LWLAFAFIKDAASLTNPEIVFLVLTAAWETFRPPAYNAMQHKSCVGLLEWCIFGTMSLACDAL